MSVRRDLIMKVTEHLERAQHPLISFEVIPPKRGENFKALEMVIERLVRYRPPFIDVTSHVSNNSNNKRPGTIGISAIIQYKYGIDAVPHVLCGSFTKEETEDVLMEFSYLGIDNLLALRGDNKSAEISPVHSGNRYALDLVQQIKKLNEGMYVDGSQGEATAFCVGVAGYPEMHPDSPNLETDLAYLKQKVDSGADYIVTQMFFDNSRYFDFVKKCKNADINVPIIPGIKVLTKPEHLQSLPGVFHLTIPEDLRTAVLENPSNAYDLGVEWAVKQAQELLDKGIPAIHFFVMGNADPVCNVVDQLRR